MNIHIHTIVFLFFMATSLFIRCSFSPGNGSDVGTGIIQGMLYRADGKTPAAHAVVVVRRKNALAAISAAGQNVAPGTVISLKTDENGIFNIDSIDSGLYIIECSDDKENMAFFDSIQVIHTDSVLKLQPGILEPAGSIKGKVVLSNGGNPIQVFILAFGIDRFSQVQSDGTFSFAPLASGQYHLKIISLDSQYGFFDTNAVVVSSGISTDIGTLTLPLRVQPQLNVNITYDTLLMKAVLSWHPTPSLITKGYNVYRVPLAADSDQVKESLRYPINQYISCLGIQPSWTDTQYVDSCCIEDKLLDGQTYHYYVTMVDSNGNEGPLSNAVTATFKSSLEGYDTIILTPSPDNIDILTPDIKDGYVTLCDFGISGGGPVVKTFAKDGSLINSWESPLNYLSREGLNGIWDWPFDSDGNFYFTQVQDNGFVLYKVLTSGVFENPVTVDESCGNKFVVDNELFMQIYPDNNVIKKINLQSGAKSVWKDFSADKVIIRRMVSDHHGGIVIEFGDPDAVFLPYFVHYKADGTPLFNSSDDDRTKNLELPGDLIAATDSLFLFTFGFIRRTVSGDIVNGRIPGIFGPTWILSDNTIAFATQDYCGPFKIILLRFCK